MTAYQGSCHCGNVKLVYESEVPPAETEVRACDCGFCRRHGSLAVSDPQGLLRFSVEDPQKLIRYRFALGTADYLLCADCGVYAAAVVIEGDQAWGIVNINLLDDRLAFSRPPLSVNYDAEDDEGRIARRRARWTPVAAG